MLNCATIRASGFKYGQITGQAPDSYWLSEKAKAVRFDAKLRIRENPRCIREHTVRNLLGRARRKWPKIVTRKALVSAKGGTGNDDLEFMVVLA